MAIEAKTTTGARTGERFLSGLRGEDREIWLEGEKVTDPSAHPKLEGAARSLARLFDLQHEEPETFLMESPDTRQPVNVTHIQPKSREDLERRRIASKRIADATVGMMGRTPDYLNYTFACFAARADVWARYGNEEGARNIVEYQKLMRDNDLALTHTLINPQVDRSVAEAEQAAGEVSLHKVEDTANGILVRGARMLATLAPFADELAVYPGSDLRLQDAKYAICFAIPIATPGLRFICRDSFSQQRDAWDYPLSTRFDEMDAVAIFDDVEIPRDRIFLDGDPALHSEVITDSHWRAHIIHQAMTRAWSKLEFAFGLGHTMADMTGVNAFDHVQEKLGELWSMLEMTRAGVVAAEAGSFRADGDGVDDWVPDERSFVALRGLMPKWIPRALELLQLVGGGGFMTTPSRADFEGPLRPAIEKYFQARNASAERRIRAFRLAWDFVGSALGGRGELYERFYLQDSFRMTALAYLLADKEHATELVEQFLRDEG
ncbi:MAG TPA: 4-hydroxyphenylacetate 3-hydroxylase N-terminal domain-containing protein [Gaiellaceae bacterium]|nr:4-hydroxyphenylacetate 3-hydroxylase N-terminal domain-containing protein [Gaiellaceae bacterium]